MDRLVVMKTFVTVAKSSSFSRGRPRAGHFGLARVAARRRPRAPGRRAARQPHRTLGEPHRSRAAVRGVRRTDPRRDRRSRTARCPARANAAEGTLSIICPKWIGTLEVGDAIAAFVREHPKITVRFELGGMSDRNYDFLDRGYDVAFHTRDLRDSNVLHPAGVGAAVRAGRLQRLRPSARCARDGRRSRRARLPAAPERPGLASRVRRRHDPLQGAERRRWSPTRTS